MSVSEHDLKTLKMALHKFAAERDWDKFHSPKNLAMALIGETAEIVEHFQWLEEYKAQKATSHFTPPSRADNLSQIKLPSVD